jgi:2-polyprenyl-3-methyl-5-hydroxy-6-metoxy-1,4-benzoquinol methylase
MNARVFPNWNELYQKQASETLPWYFPTLDPDLERGLAARKLSQGRALDLGTGPGTQAVALAERGFHVIGSDLSGHAIEQARTRYAEKKLSLEFVQDDVLSSELTPGFDLVFDRGCFHVMSPELRAGYAQTLATLVKPGAVFFLKTFSCEQPGDVGPYRLTLGEIESTFKAAFEIVSVERTVYQGTLDPLPIAWFCTLLKR